MLRRCYMWLLAVSGIRGRGGIVICRLRGRIFTVRLTGRHRSAYGNAALASLRAYFLNFTFPRGVPSAAPAEGYRVPLAAKSDGAKGYPSGTREPPCLQVDKGFDMLSPNDLAGDA